MAVWVLELDCLDGSGWGMLGSWCQPDSSLSISHIVPSLAIATKAAFRAVMLIGFLFIGLAHWHD
jgi:hypothetical protein